MCGKKPGKVQKRRPNDGAKEKRRVRKADDSDNRPTPDRHPNDASKHDDRTHSA